MPKCPDMALSSATYAFRTAAIARITVEAEHACPVEHLKVPVLYDTNVTKVAHYGACTCEGGDEELAERAKGDELERSVAWHTE